MIFALTKVHYKKKKNYINPILSVMLTLIPEKPIFLIDNALIL